MTSAIPMPPVPGVYLIECLGNDKVFIGSGVNMLLRQRHHLWALRANRHSNIRLQRAFNKYGELSFMFYVLEMTSLETLRAVEAYWIKALDAVRRGFNIVYDTISPALGHKHTAASRLARSLAMTGRGNPMFGRRATVETRAAMSNAHLGRPIHSEAEKQRRSLRMMGNTLGKKK